MAILSCAGAHYVLISMYANPVLHSCTINSAFSYLTAIFWGIVITEL